ncbi:TIGR04222 domain-containing membrane protein [Nonomuraea sp. NPDC050556]|uniref:TIGR04222 domain-containing membrane protein n=1 Tax=Nonomuraea sp. NPDC050556 TaxID=3364369 RepID=UPI0037968DD2
MDIVLTLSAFAVLLLVVASAAWTAFALAAARVPLPVGLGLYETAYLKGGPRRVINTALVSLVDKGGVHVSRDGTVTPVTGYGDRSDPVESAVYQQVRRNRQGRSAAQVRHAVARHRAMADLTGRLREAGLLKGPGEVRRAVRPLRWLRVCIAAAGVVALASALPLPSIQVRTLVVAAVAAALGLACLYVLGPRLRRQLTMPGTGGEEVAAGAAAPVALHGLARLPDRELSEALRRDTRVRARNSSRRVGGGGYVATCCAPGECGSHSHDPMPGYGSGSCGALVGPSDSGGGGGCGSGSSSCGGSSGCGGGGCGSGS